MRKMKRVAALALVSIMVLSACSGGGQSNTAAEQPAAKTKQETSASKSEETISIKVTTTQNPNQQMGKGMALLEENLKKELGDGVKVMAMIQPSFILARRRLQRVNTGTYRCSLVQAVLWRR